MGVSQHAGERTRRQEEGARELRGLLGEASLLGGGGTMALRAVEAQRGAFSHLSNDSPSFSRVGKAGLSACIFMFLPTPPCNAKGSRCHPRSIEVKLKAEARCPEPLSYLMTEPGLKTTLSRVLRGMALMAQG